KSPREAARLVIAMAERQGQGLVSRMTDDHASALTEAASAAHVELVRYHSSARALRGGFAPEAVAARVGILTAGTSDVAVADEARMVVEACGMEVRLESDLGVAGLHRFVGPLAAMLEWGADVIVVAAGMDGVLPGLVAGLIELPVIGLPVSTGYGRGGAGEAALTTMLQSCSTGLTVVNIDNGVGAGGAEAAARRRWPARSPPLSASQTPRRRLCVMHPHRPESRRERRSRRSRPGRLPAATENRDAGARRTRATARSVAFSARSQQRR